MRITLNIDDDVLRAAKELAAAQKRTVGQVLSDLARTALTAPTAPLGPAGPGGSALQLGWYVLPHREGVIVTNELIYRLMDEADLEDAGIYAHDTGHR